MQTDHEKVLRALQAAHDWIEEDGECLCEHGYICDRCGLLDDLNAAEQLIKLEAAQE